jgi:hypothetical protein
MELLAVTSQLTTESVTFLPGPTTKISGPLIRWLRGVSHKRQLPDAYDKERGLSPADLSIKDSFIS